MSIHSSILMGDFAKKLFITSTCPYAAILEYGTSRTPARNYIRPVMKHLHITKHNTLDNLQNEIIEGIKRNITQEGLIDTGTLLRSFKGEIK